MKRALFFTLIAASCAHRVNLQTSTQVDAFQVTCPNTNCTWGQPRKVFTTSQPVSGDVLVARNGQILYGGPQNYDYSAAADSVGKVTITFTSQPVTDGDLIQLRYAASGQR